MSMTPEQRLAHYGYEIRQDGTHWTFSPNGRGALLRTRELALTRAEGALNLELKRAEHLMQRRAVEVGCGVSFSFFRDPSPGVPFKGAEA